MVDVFISYAREDEAKACLLAGALELRQWSVWWDRNIFPGRSFDAEIQKALSSAKCVVVLWSCNSVESDWVKDEASEGRRRGRLVPACLDDTAVPLGFRQLQVANLTDWTGREPHPEFEKLIEAISEHLENDGEGLGRRSPGKRSWSAELISKGYGFRIVRVHLSYESHWIECRVLYKLKVPIIVRVDNETVASSYRNPLPKRGATLDFEIADGATRYAASVEVHTGWFDQINKCVLRIAQKELISI